MNILDARARFLLPFVLFSPLGLSSLHGEEAEDSVLVRASETHPASLTGIIAGLGFSALEIAPGFSEKEEWAGLDPASFPLSVVSLGEKAFAYEEKRSLAEYVERGGSLLLVSLSCSEPQDGPGEAELLNDLLEGMGGLGTESGFRFEPQPKPPLAGRILASMPGDPVTRGVQEEYEDIRFAGGHALTIDSFLNPSVRAFSLVGASGERWPFLALAVVGSGKLAAFGAGSSLVGCGEGAEQSTQPDQHLLPLFGNVISWLLAGGSAAGDSMPETEHLVLSEVMWGGEAVREYLEFFNEGDREVDIEGWTLTDGEGVYILKGRVPPGGYYLLEYSEFATPVIADEVYGDDSPDLVLDDAGDRLSLLDRWGDIVAVVNVEESSWPAGFADGRGASMELIDHEAGYGVSNWRSSVGGDIVPSGTPRAQNSTEVITPFVPDFRASVKEGGIVLEWSMKRGDSISHYNLYRSVDSSSEPLEGRGPFMRITDFPLPADSTRFLDTGIDSSLTYRYLLGVVFTNGVEYFSEPVSISLKWLEEPRPYAVTMDQNFPNPFNPTTEVRFDIKDLGTSGKPIEVSVLVYSPRGHVVRRLYERQTYPGTFSVRWDGRDENGEEVASGAYYYQLLVQDTETGHVLVRLSRKMVLMR